MTTSGQAGALIAGRYRLERPTGGGTWPEEIWQGFDETLNRPVMMRLLPIEGNAEPDLEEQVQSVVAQVARLGHPNIAQVYDVGHEGSLRYVISEWTGGRTLGQIMATGRQPWQRTVDWGEQIAEALAALHAVGLVDGVLGPETVSVMDDRRVKLTDVGLGAQEGGAGRARGADDQATQLFPGAGGGFGADPEATRLMGPGGADDDATRMMPPRGGNDDATRMVPPYGNGADDPTRMVPASSYGDDADATRLVSGGPRGAVPPGAASDVYALGAILWTALVGYPPEVGPGDTAGPDLNPLRDTGAPADLAMLLQSMLAASAPLRPSASVTANRFAALSLEAREPRSEALPTAVLGAAAAGEATRAVGPLRLRDDDDYEPAPRGAGSSGSGRRAGIAIGVALLVVLAGVAIALILSNQSNNNNAPTGSTSVTAPTTSPGQISVSAAPSTSAAATTTSAAATTTSAAPTTSSAAPTTTSASPSASATPTNTDTDTGTDTATASPSDTSNGQASSSASSSSTGGGNN